MGNSKSIYYEECDEDLKSKILLEFIKKYSDKNITGIPYWDNDTKKKNEIYIDIDRYPKIIFKSKLELIKLVEKLGRPFIMMGDFPTDRNTIYFVYDSEKEKKN
jgi:hypothetical protein